MRILGDGRVGIGTTTPDNRARVTVAAQAGSMFGDIYIGKRESSGSCWADFEQGVAVGNAGTGSNSSIVGALGYYQCLYGNTGPRTAGLFLNTNNTTYDYSIYARGVAKFVNSGGSNNDVVFIKGGTPYQTDNGGHIIFGPYDGSNIATATGVLDAGWRGTNNPTIQMVVARDGKNYNVRVQYDGWIVLDALATSYPSSKRWKEHIKTIDDPLGKVLNLRGVYFDWKKEKGGSHGMGMIAEEVEKVIPELVQYEDDANG